MKFSDSVHASSKSNEWSTPQTLFDELNKEFDFTLDPCCTKENAKCNKFYTKEDDGLSKSWQGERVFMNPPYGREVGKWVEKAANEAVFGKCLVVGLIAARTDTKYFHKYIYPYAQLRFIEGRVKFLLNGEERGSPGFPSLIFIMGAK